MTAATRDDGPPVIRIDPDDPGAPPRRNGELTFDAPWQARAFGLAVALLDRHGRPWADFRTHLVAAIATAPTAPYYEQFVAALGTFGDELAGTAEKSPG